MRIIPKNTKVSTEFFKGLTMADMIVGFFGVLIVFLIAISSLPYRGYIAIGFAFVLAFLLVRIDDEANYLFLFRIIRHFSYYRSYQKPGFTYPQDEVDSKAGEETAEYAEMAAVNDETVIQEFDTTTPVISTDITGDSVVLEKAEANSLQAYLGTEEMNILDLDDEEFAQESVEKPVDTYAGIKKKTPQSVWKNIRNKSQKAKKGDS